MRRGNAGQGNAGQGNAGLARRHAPSEARQPAAGPLPAPHGPLRARPLPLRRAEPHRALSGLRAPRPIRAVSWPGLHHRQGTDPGPCPSGQGPLAIMYGIVPAVQVRPPSSPTGPARPILPGPSWPMPAAHRTLSRPARSCSITPPSSGRNCGRGVASLPPSRKRSAYRPAPSVAAARGAPPRRLTDHSDACDAPIRMRRFRFLALMPHRGSQSPLEGRRLNAA